MRRWLAGIALLLSVPAAAAPGDWQKGERARAVDVAARLWPTVARCTDADPHLRRQCQRVRDAALAKSGDQLLLVPGDPLAIKLGPWDGKKKSLTISLAGCIACAEPVEIGGRKTKVVTRGPAVLAKVEQPFADADLADEWRDGAARRLRSELLVRVPKTPLLTPGGLAVEVVGFRLWDPCDGKLLAGSEGAVAGAIEAGSCKVEPRSSAIAGSVVVGRDRLLPDDIEEGVAPVRMAIQRCAYRFGAQGGGEVVMEVGGDGTPKKAETKGEFAGTPAGDCVVKAVQAARFRPFRRAQMTIVFPFTFSR
jgi:hypothetical protein